MAKVADVGNDPVGSAQPQDKPAFGYVPDNPAAEEERRKKELEKQDEDCPVCPLCWASLIAFILAFVTFGAILVYFGYQAVDPTCDGGPGPGIPECAKENQQAYEQIVTGTVTIILTLIFGACITCCISELISRSRRRKQIKKEKAERRKARAAEQRLQDYSDLADSQQYLEQPRIYV